jgi:hypothetical protein
LEHEALHGLGLSKGMIGFYSTTKKNILPKLRAIIEKRRANPAQEQYAP